MKKTNPVDAARIELMLSDLRLPAIKSMWAKLAEQSETPRMAPSLGFLVLVVGRRAGPTIAALAREWERGSEAPRRKHFADGAPNHRGCALTIPPRARPARESKPARPL